MGAGNSGAPVLNVRGEVIGMVAATLAGEPAAGNYSASPAAPLSVQVYDKSTYRLGSNAQQNGNTRSTSTQVNVQQNAAGNATASRSVTPQSLPVEQILLDRAAAQPRTVLPGGNTGFAIPVNEFKSIIETLKAGKNVVHAWLGLDLEDIDNAHEEKGVVRLERQVRVRSLFADSIALKSGGIQVGDIILKMNGKPVHTVNEARSTILVVMKPGQKVEIELQRNGKTRVVTLTAEDRPTIIPPRRSFAGE